MLWFIWSHRVRGSSMTLSPSPEVVLFDMDGTLLDAASDIERIWAAWARRHDADAAMIIAQSRGQRTIETVRMFARQGAKTEDEVRWLSEQAHLDPIGPSALPGAVAFIHGLPLGRWAVVTSAERARAERWLTAARLPGPPVLVSGEDVTAGKPAPEGYRVAAQKLSGTARKAVIFEDTEAGVRAAAGAGSRVIGVANPLIKSHPDIALWIKDFTQVSVSQSSEGRLVVCPILGGAT